MGDVRLGDWFRAFLPIAGGLWMPLAVLFGAGQIDRAHTFERWLVALPIAFMGVVLGNRLARHIPPPAMRRAMAVLLIASGLSLTQHLWR